LQCNDISFLWHYEITIEDWWLAVVRCSLFRKMVDGWSFDFTQGKWL